MNFRLRDYLLYPLAIWQHHQFLKESQYWPVEKRQAWLQERLDRILRYAVKSIPYYKRTLSPFESRFNQMIDRLDLSELPVITKNIIRENYQGLMPENTKRLRARMDHTSGSTGAPMNFLLDKSSDIKHFPAIWRMLNWTGYKFGHRYASLSTTFEKKTDKLYLYDFKQNCLQIPFVNLTKDNVKECSEKLQKFHPAVIKTYPSAMAVFAHWLKEAGIHYRPKAILCCAETLLDHQRKAIHETLQCPIFDFYSQNERACLISTCEKERYHIHEEYSFVELIKDNEPSAEPSAQIIATTFDNLAMPFIRYQTNDRAILDDAAPCDCGRTYKTVQKIIGRVEDVIYTPEGRQVTRMDVPFKYSPGIQEAQIAQKQIDKIEISILRSPSFQQKDLDTLQHHLHLRLGDNMEIEFKFVDAIPLGKNGKKKFIISEMKKNSIFSNQDQTVSNVIN